MEAKFDQIKEALERFGCTRVHKRNDWELFMVVQFDIPAGLQAPTWRFLAELEQYGAYEIEFNTMDQSLDMHCYLTIDKL